jgi:hypothetical protein
MTIDNIIGNQLAGGTMTSNSDRIINMLAGTYSWLRNTGVWSGTFASFADNTPYEFHHRTSTVLNVNLTGYDISEPQTIGTFNQGYG